jgi:hypothetical protein
MGLDSPRANLPEPAAPEPPPPPAAPAHPGWDTQFTPAPPRRLDPPAPLPYPPVPPPPVPALELGQSWNLHLRLSRLRAQARQDAARGTTLTNLGASLIVGACVIGIIFFSAQMFGASFLTGMSTVAGPGGQTGPGSTETMLLAVAWCLQFVLFGGLAVFAVSVLSKASALFNSSYQAALRRFSENGVAVLIVQEEFAQMIRDKLTMRTWIQLTGRSTYRTLEDHFDWCACHFPALCQLAAGQRELKLMPLRREENLFNSRKLFMQQTWVYFVGGCILLFLTNIGFIFTVIYTMYGGRYINSRGVLVALCDFMLQDGWAEPGAEEPAAGLPIG